MKNLKIKTGCWLLAPLLPLACVHPALFPEPALAKTVYTSGGGVVTGDPIDGNDYGTDPGGGWEEVPHQTSSVVIESSAVLVPLFGDGTVLLLVPDLKSGLFLKIMILADPGIQDGGPRCAETR